MSVSRREAAAARAAAAAVRQDERLISALEEEKRGYVTRGDATRSKAVDSEIKKAKERLAAVPQGGETAMVATEPAAGRRSIKSAEGDTPTIEAIDKSLEEAGLKIDGDEQDRRNRLDEFNLHGGTLAGEELDEALKAVNLPKTGTVAEKRRRLVEYRTRTAV